MVVVPPSAQGMVWSRSACSALPVQPGHRQRWSRSRSSRRSFRGTRYPSTATTWPLTGSVNTRVHSFVMPASMRAVSGSTSCPVRSRASPRAGVGVVAGEDGRGDDDADLGADAAQRLAGGLAGEEQVAERVGAALVVAAGVVVVGVAGAGDLGEPVEDPVGEHRGHDGAHHGHAVVEVGDEHLPPVPRLAVPLGERLLEERRELAAGDRAQPARRGRRRVRQQRRLERGTSLRGREGRADLGDHGDVAAADRRRAPRAQGRGPSFDGVHRLRHLGLDGAVAAPLAAGRARRRGRGSRRRCRASPRSPDRSRAGRGRRAGACASPASTRPPHRSRPPPAWPSRSHSPPSPRPERRPARRRSSRSGAAATSPGRGPRSHSGPSSAAGSSGTGSTGPRCLAGGCCLPRHGRTLPRATDTHPPLWTTSPDPDRARSGASVVRRMR